MLGNADCEGSSLGWRMPQVYAIDATSGRDTQPLIIRTDLYAWSGSDWTYRESSDWYRGLSADDRPASVFNNVWGGEPIGMFDRLAFTIPQPGRYRAAQHIIWERTSAARLYSIYAWLPHPGGTGGDTYCTVG